MNYMCSFAWRAYDDEEERKNKRDLCLGVSRVFFHLSSTPTTPTRPTTIHYYRRMSDLYGFDTAHPSRIGSRSSLADSDGENVIAAAFPQKKESATPKIRIKLRCKAEMITVSSFL